MKTLRRHFIASLTTCALLVQTDRSLASSIIALSTADHLAASAAVFRGVVVGSSCFRDVQDGQIHTRTSLRVLEPMKGTFPSIVTVVHRGGALGEERDFSGHSPRFAPAGEYLVYVVRRPDGKLTATQGGSSAVQLRRIAGQLIPEQEALLQELRARPAAGQSSGEDVTDQAGAAVASLVTGLLVNGAGISSRFLQTDRGEPIPVLIDADSLPTGITLAQATNAITQACSAWAAVTQLKFQIEGVQSFGAGADTLAANDEKLRIQLHDNYNRISSIGTLGVGGRGSHSSPLGNTGWDLGGRVGTNEFYKTAHGYVILEHGATAMRNLLTFTEVLCHEIGHALSMAHSSENPGEPDSTLQQAIMYYQTHADGRGAALGIYDPPIIQQAYPLDNTPPYTYGRVMDITTAFPQPDVGGVNSVELRGYDLQSSPLFLNPTNSTASNGDFTTAEATIKYTAAAEFSDSERFDPAGPDAFDRLYARYSDGTNASPYVSVRVISFSLDDQPAGTSDGIPNTWMNTYWGNANPAAGPNRGAQQDWDNDGMKNLDEYRAGMDPTLPASGQRITFRNDSTIQFQAKPYELYELHSSTNLVDWVRAVNPILPTNTTGTFTGVTNHAPALFFRVQKVP